jgi:hypothetical protein
LWHYWTQRKKALVNGHEIEAWCNAPRDREGQPMPPVHLDEQRWKALDASLDAQENDPIVGKKRTAQSVAGVGGASSLAPRSPRRPARSAP